MALDERTLRYIAARMNADAAERYASRPGAGGYANADRPTLARALQDLGGIGGQRQTIVPMGDRQQTINVNTAPSVPAGAARPSTPDESALASQAGWAGANEAVAPYLGDWRATPAQILAAAVGGYNRSRYAAQQDIAAQRQQQQLFDLKKQEMEAAQAAAQAKRDQAAQAKAMVDQLPEAQRARGQILFALGQYDELADLINPEQKRQITGSEAAGWFSVDPNDPSQVTQVIPGIGRAPTAPVARYDISNGVVLDKFTGQTTGIPVASAPDTQLGKLLAEMNALAPDDPRREVYKAAISKATTASGGMSVGFDEHGNPVIETGAAAAPKPPSGYRWTDHTYSGLEPIPGGPGEAASAEIAGKAAMLPGSIADVQAARDMLIDPKSGEVKYGTIALANPPLPGIPFVGSVGPLPGGRDVSSRISGAIDTLVRARTGAAATDQEMQRLSSMYMPGYTDPPELVKSKLDRLDRDLRVMQDQFMRGKGGVANAPQIPDPEQHGQTMMNPTGKTEPVPTIDNGAPSPAAQPPGPPVRDPAAFVKQHW